MNVDLNSILNEVAAVLPPEFAGFVGFPVVLVAVILLGLLAMYSYKIFRITLTVGGSIVCGVLGSMFVAPFVTGFIGKSVMGFDMVYSIGFICALLGGLLMNSFFKLALFISGAGAGWIMGGTVVYGLVVAMLPNVPYINEPLGMLCVKGVCALVVGILSLFLFKFIYIVFTSLGGMIGAILLVIISVKPHPGTPVLMVAVLIGLILGIIAASKQYKNSGDKPHHAEDEK